MAGRVSPHSTAYLMFKKKSNKMNVTLCDWSSVLCIKLCFYMILFVSNSLNNFVTAHSAVTVVFLAVVPFLGSRGLSRVLILWDKSQGKESKSMFGWREAWFSFMLTSCVESGLGNYCFKLNQKDSFLPSSTTLII